MKVKLLVSAAVLALLPGVALAMGCGRDHAKNDCALGETWDNATQSCVKLTSS